MTCIPMRIARYLGLWLGLFVLVGGWFPALGVGQTFTSGSTGANGPFPPAAPPDGTTDITLDLNDGVVTFLPDGSNMTLQNIPAGGFQDGILHFTTVDIPPGVTLTFVSNQLNTPVTILAQGNVTVSGTININGEEGGSSSAGGRGGFGGPGGFRGGNGQVLQTNPPGGTGLGPGGGGGSGGSGEGSGGGFATPGGLGASSQDAGRGSVGGTYGSASLLPLIGGSGGGGGASGLTDGSTGAGGAGAGGGGGAILIASSGTITVDSTGRILARGGLGGASSSGGREGGGGSGGAIRLIANTITGSGTLDARGDSRGGLGGQGRIRFEAFSFTFQTNSTSGVVTNATSGVVFPPTAFTVRLTSVGGQNVSAAPTGGFGGIDLTLTAPGTVTVNLMASQVPLGTTIAVTAKPATDGDVIGPIRSSGLVGELTNATASVDLTLPSGGVYFLEAQATFEQATP